MVKRSGYAPAGRSIGEVAEYLGVSRATVSGLIKAKGLSTVRCKRNGKAKLLGPAEVEILRRAVAPEAAKTTRTIREPVPAG